MPRLPRFVLVGQPQHVIVRKLSPTDFSEANGTFNYVVLEDGSLKIGRIFDMPGGGHIDLAQGAGVTAAGEVRIIQNQIKWIDNTSGHYEPVGTSARNSAVSAFESLGYSNSAAKYVPKHFDETIGAWVPDHG